MAVNVCCSSMPDYEEYCREIRDLWESHWLTNMGTKHKQLEEKLRHRFKTENLTLFANGHLALSAIIAAFDFPRGSEIITTPFTFASTTHAIVQNGLTPVFCDIRADDFTLDAAKLEPLITEKTRAILPVHVYGNLCDVQEIQRIADDYQLKVIYDAAHAFGVTIRGTNAAEFGDASMFSFHATKVFHTVEGGAAVYRDAALCAKLDALKNFGMAGQEDAFLVGGNAKMSEFHAAMGLCNLRHIDEEICRRKLVVERYQERLRGVSGIRFCAAAQNVRSNYAYFPVVIDPETFGADRDAVCAALAANDIYARKYFYPLTNCFSCYAGQYEAAIETPVAWKISHRVLTLPLYAGLALEDADRICKIIISCHR